MFGAAEDTLVFAVVVELETLTAFIVGFGTPLGFMLPLNVLELMPLIDNHPRVSQ